ncbi:MAG: hypothetical protein KGL39_07445 [Patescibacteria group bacterium]|nr:hypothetical protein [Patescibacteria group bacterium]
MTDQNPNKDHLPESEAMLFLVALCDAISGTRERLPETVANRWQAAENFLCRPAPRGEEPAGDDWQKRAAKECNWRQTPIGAAFARFDNLLARYWQLDGQEHVSDRRLREAADAAEAARRDFLFLLRGW